MRPRSAVDYRSTTGTCKTPGWMPLGTKKAVVEPPSAQASDKENAQPLGVRLKAAQQSKAAVKKAGQKKRAVPEPSSKAEGSSEGDTPVQTKPTQAGQPGSRRSGRDARSQPQPTGEAAAQPAEQDKVQEPATAQQTSRPSRNKAKSGREDPARRQTVPGTEAAHEASSTSEGTHKPAATAAAAPSHPAGKQRKAAGPQQAAEQAPPAKQRKRPANARKPAAVRSREAASSEHAPDPQAAGQLQLPPPEASSQLPADKAATVKRRKLTNQAAQRPSPAAAQPASAAADSRPEHALAPEAAQQPQQQQAMGADTRPEVQLPQQQLLQLHAAAEQAAQGAGSQQATLPPLSDHFLKLKVGSEMLHDKRPASSIKLSIQPKRQLSLLQSLITDKHPSLPTTALICHWGLKAWTFAACWPQSAQRTT